MSQNGQTHFQNLAVFAANVCCKILKLCLTILGHYALNDKALSFSKYLFMKISMKQPSLRLYRNPV